MNTATATLTLLALILVTNGGPGGPDQESGRPRMSQEVSLMANPRMRLIFYAVLEGLYEDGVSTKDARCILGETKGPLSATNFVPGCPVCIPAVEALRVYVGRLPFKSYKTKPDTFGKGLDAATKARLRSPEVRQRFDSVQQLVSRWIERRLTAMRLTSEERDLYRRDFEFGRKIGMSTLAAMRALSTRGAAEAPWGDLGQCAACNAAVEAAGTR